ncbi:hypothetical protein [Paraburkholderia caribensis]|uniref:hypothetical protein n=1 Tax=Paraburkholderia caribensis TaxID=75105 RepID=UPI001D09975C|nr:hypothetical protein [Paraburkholderia caribensis]
MTEEELSRMTGVDPLWVHMTPCLRRKTIERRLARRRSDGVTLDQMREQLADQLASNPDFNRFVTDFYGLREGEIPGEIRQRHVACVAGTVMRRRTSSSLMMCLMCASGEAVVKELALQ